MEKDTAYFQLKFDKDLRDEIKAICKETGLTMHGFFIQASIEFLAKLKKQRKQKQKTKWAMMSY